MTTLMHHGWVYVRVIAVVIGCTGCSIAAQAELILEIQILRDASFTERAGTSDRDELEGVEITLGQPISIRLCLRNEADEDTNPFVASLRPEDGAVRIFIRPVGGDAHRIQTERWELRRRMVQPRSMLPREQICFETWLFGELDIRPERIRGSKYIFSQDGEYEVYCVFVARSTSSVHAQDGVEFLESIRSNTVKVIVSEPEPWWPPLAASGIVDVIERGIDTRNMHPENRAQMFQLIDLSDVKAFTDWKRKQVERAELNAADNN